MYAVMLGDATLANGVEGRHSLYEKARSDKEGSRSPGTLANTTYNPSQILEMALLHVSTHPIANTTPISISKVLDKIDSPR